jgi:hypothetical protein
MMIALSPLLAGPSIAGPVKVSDASAQQKAAHGAGSNFRLLAQPAIDDLRAYHTDIGVETAVSTNSTLGLGVIRASPRTPDSRLYGRISRPRSAAVKFRLKF